MRKCSNKQYINQDGNDSFMLPFLNNKRSYYLFTVLHYYCQTGRRLALRPARSAFDKSRNAIRVLRISFHSICVCCIPYIRDSILSNNLYITIVFFNYCGGTAIRIIRFVAIKYIDSGYNTGPTVNNFLYYKMCSGEIWLIIKIIL